MSTHEEGLGYNAFKIFIILFILTALEVAWGVTLREQGRLILWGGLLAFALAKGILILMYFMHMKYEKMIVWSLILPTPILICVVLFALMPDISFNDGQLDTPIGSMRQADGSVAGLALENQHAGPEGKLGGKHGAELRAEEHAEEQHEDGDHDEDGGH